MSLKEELRAVTGNRRRFLLFRIADVDVNTARELCGINVGTYNTWLKDPIFIELYRRRDILAGDYKEEALKLLRRSTQLAAVLLEEKIVQKIGEEIESGNYNLIKTQLARTVYDKLISDLDVVPQITATMSWEERVHHLLVETPRRNMIEDISPGRVLIEDITPEGGMLEGNTETDHSQENQPEKSLLSPKGR